MKISVLQWNIWNQENIENIVALLDELKPDIICAQELTINWRNQTHKDTPAYVAEQLGYNHTYKAMPLTDTDGTPFTIADGIFTRFPIQEQRSTFINESRSDGGYDDEYRAYVEATLNIDGKTFTVATSHMSYTHQFEPTPNKNREADNLVTELRKHNRDFIFAGDLNAPPDSYTIQQISKLMQSVGPEMTQKTWTTKPFSYNGFEATDLNWRIDYAFATSDVKIISSQIIQTEYSDHLPILVEFEL